MFARAIWMKESVAPSLMSNESLLAVVSYVVVAAAAAAAAETEFA
jgi:hypothetical protein